MRNLLVSVSVLVAQVATASAGVSMYRGYDPGKPPVLDPVGQVTLPWTDPDPIPPATRLIVYQSSHSGILLLSDVGGAVEVDIPSAIPGKCCTDISTCYDWTSPCIAPMFDLFVPGESCDNAIDCCWDSYCGGGYDRTCCELGGGRVVDDCALDCP